MQASGQPFAFPEGSVGGTESEEPLSDHHLEEVPLPSVFEVEEVRPKPNKPPPRPRPVGTSRPKTTDLPVPPDAPIATLAGAPVLQIVQQAYEGRDVPEPQQPPIQNNKDRPNANPNPAAPSAVKGRTLRSVTNAKRQTQLALENVTRKRSAEREPEGQEKRPLKSKKKDTKYWTWGLIDANGNRVG